LQIELRKPGVDDPPLTVLERPLGVVHPGRDRDHAPVGPVVVHYHFESKDELLAAAFRHAADADIRRLEKSLAENADAVEQLDRLVREYLPGGRGEKGWVLWIDAWGEALRDPALRRISAELDLAWVQAIEGVITDGVTAGQFRCDDPRAAAWRLASLMDGLSLQLVAHRGLLTRTTALEYTRAAAEREVGAKMRP
jgi:AcrR family transcriptional regulator